MFENKKAIFFDMDGTLIDSVGIWNSVDQRLIEIISDGKIIEYDLSVIQHQRDTELSKNYNAPNAYLEYCLFLKKKYNAKLSSEDILSLRYDIAQTYLTEQVDYKPYVDVFLKKLRGDGLTLVVTSTTRRKNMEVYRKSNANLRRKANIDDFFARIYTREDVTRIKPDPEVYLLAMRELKLSPNECLVFEDSLVGVQAATRAGIQTVAVFDIYSKNDWQEIIKLANYHISSYNELL